jgi:hypothetical protein
MTSKETASMVKERYSAELLARPGVAGVGTEREPDGDWVIVVHLDPAHAPTEQLPTVLDGVPVRTVTDGPFVAHHAR